MEPGWSGERAGGNVQILAERTESIGDNCNSRHDNDTQCTGLRSHPSDTGKVHLLRQKQVQAQLCRLLFPSLISKIISRYRMPRRAPGTHASSTSAFPTQKLRKGPQGEVDPGKAAKGNHSFIYSNHRYLLDVRSWARFWRCKNVRVLW